MNHLLRPRIWPSFSPSCRLYEPEARRPRVSVPATYRSGAPRNPAVPRDGCPVAHPSSSRSLRSAQSRKRVPSFVVSRQQLKLSAARPVDETCRRAQVVSLRSSRCRESSKCKVLRPFYCSSLAHPSPLLRTGGCARQSIFMKHPG
jgi:hypothetical protein